MSFISIHFIIFILICLAVYYVAPKGIRWVVLLIASIFFYGMAGWNKLVYVAVSWLTAYMAARIVENFYEKNGDADVLKKKARAVTMSGAAVILLLLVVSKTSNSILTALDSIAAGRIGFLVMVPLGISYYTFGIVGYLADVYWKKDKAEHNPFKLLLYMIYFPHIIEGPIPRHKKLSSRLVEGHEFDYQRICFGMQRMLWGFFKKLVIADRVAVIVNQVFGSIESYAGFELMIAVMLSALQMYTDFSGCMDIALGVSECFGITLEENFKRPFFSRNAAEFWKRWHITLGSWFKDYVCMPITIMGPVKKLSKTFRKKWGARAGRNATTVPALIAVWICTGIWHGTGMSYVLWGCYWGGILIFSTIFEPQLQGINEKLHINTESRWFIRFQMLRTFMIFCGGKLLTAPGTVAKSALVFKRMISVFNPWVFVDGTLYTLGLDRLDFWVAVFATLLLWKVSYLQESGVRIRQMVADCPIVIRWIAYLLLIFIVLIFGYYGAGFDASSFVYMKF